MADIASYRVLERQVVCGAFRGDKICSAGPPSSGAAQIMLAGIYDNLVHDGSSVLERKVAFVDAQRLAYADRDQFFGDPDAVQVPLDVLLSPAYLAHRAATRFPPDGKAVPGEPHKFQQNAQQFGRDSTEEAHGTTHLSIIDQFGNAVSMTATVEAPFGSSRWVNGYLLNNEMTDFARRYAEAEAPQANAIRPGMRPRSSMSPTMIFDGAGQLKMVTGSPGGN